MAIICHTVQVCLAVHGGDLLEIELISCMNSVCGSC